MPGNNPIEINPLLLSDENRQLFNELLIQHAEECEKKPKKDRKLLKTNRKLLKWERRSPAPYKVKENELNLTSSVIYIDKKTNVSKNILSGLGWPENDVLMFSIPVPTEGLPPGGNFGTIETQYIYYLNKKTGEYKYVPFALKELKYYEKIISERANAYNEGLNRFIQAAQEEKDYNAKLYDNQVQAPFYINRKSYHAKDDFVSPDDGTDISNPNKPPKAYIGIPLIQAETIKFKEKINDQSLLGKLQDPANLHRLSHLLYRRIYEMHAKKILHRDIKPENFMILFDKDNKIIDLNLVDFGLAKDLTTKTAPHAGTMDYVDPSVLNTRIVFNNADKNKLLDIYAYTVCIALSLMKQDEKQNFLLQRRTNRRRYEYNYYKVETKNFIDDLPYREEWSEVLTNLLGPYLDESGNQIRATLPEYPELVFEALQEKVSLLALQKRELNDPELSSIIDRIKNLSSEEKGNPIYYLVLRKKLEKALDKHKNLSCLKRNDASLAYIDAFYEAVKIQHKNNLENIRVLEFSVFNNLIENLNTFSTQQNASIQNIYKEIDKLKCQLASEESGFAQAQIACIENIKKEFETLGISVNNLNFNRNNSSNTFSLKVKWLKDVFEARIRALKTDIFWLEVEIATRKTKESINKASLNQLEAKLEKLRDKSRDFENKLWQLSQHDSKTPKIFFEIISSLQEEEKELLSFSLPGYTASKAQQQFQENFDVHEILSILIQNIDALFDISEIDDTKNLLKKIILELLSFDTKWLSLTTDEKANRNILNFFQEKITDYTTKIENIIKTMQDPVFQEAWKIFKAVTQEVQSPLTVPLKEQALVVQKDILTTYAQDKTRANNQNKYIEALQATDEVLKEPTLSNIENFSDKINVLNRSVVKQDNLLVRSGVYGKEALAANTSSTSATLKASHLKASAFAFAAIAMIAVIPVVLATTLSISPLMLLGVGVSLAAGLCLAAGAHYHASTARTIQGKKDKLMSQFTLFTKATTQSDENANFPSHPTMTNPKSK